MFFFLTQFLQNVLGYSPLKSGLAFLPLTVMVFSSSQFSARVLTDAVQPRTLVVSGITVSTGALLWLSTAVTRTAATSRCSARWCSSAWATARRSCR